MTIQGDLLVRDEDLESRDEVSQGDGLVVLPLLVGVEVVDEDEEVVVLTLEVDLDLSCVALHLDCFGGCGWCVGDERRSMVRFAMNSVVNSLFTVAVVMLGK